MIGARDNRSLSNHRVGFAENCLRFGKIGWAVFFCAASAASYVSTAFCLKDRFDLAFLHAPPPSLSFYLNSFLLSAFYTHKAVSSYLYLSVCLSVRLGRQAPVAFYLYLSFPLFSPFLPYPIAETCHKTKKSERERERHTHTDSGLGNTTDASCGMDL
jgi:hypothetical protein